MNVLKKISKCVLLGQEILIGVNKCRSMLGEIEAWQLQERMRREKTEGGGIVPGRLNDYEFQVYSQWGEDGIIQYLVHNLDISREIFIEFGVQDYTESNTRFLLIHNNWSGLVIDGSQDNIDYIRRDEIYWRHNLKAEQHFITAENINDIFRNNGISGKIGLLSIDIDGNDYWVWNAIDCVDADIVICEYNSRLGCDRAITIPYDPEFIRGKAHYSHLYFGASIRALTMLAEKKGYALVGGNTAANDLFFVKRGLLNDRIKECSVEEAYRMSQCRPSRDQQGNLNYLSNEEAIALVENMPYEEIN